MAASFQLVIDCADPEPLARFWAAKLDTSLTASRYFELTLGGDYQHVYGHVLEDGKRAAADSTSQALLRVRDLNTVAPSVRERGMPQPGTGRALWPCALGGTRTPTFFDAVRRPQTARRVAACPRDDA